MLPTVQAPERHGWLAVQPDPDTEPYWQALAEGRLLLPRCESCRRRWSPPSATCPHCGGRDHGWVEHDGRGRIYSWTTVHRALDEAFADDPPYVVAVVTLDDADGARLVGRLLGDLAPGPGSLRVTPDLPVQTVAYRVSAGTGGGAGEQSLPGFLPLRTSLAPEEKGTS